MNVHFYPYEGWKKGKRMGKGGGKEKEKDGEGEREGVS